MFGVVSLTMGNSALPLRDSLTRNVQLIGKLFLAPSILAAEKGNFFG
jgi:hypothetical protein